MIANENARQGGQGRFTQVVPAAKSGTSTPCEVRPATTTLSPTPIQPATGSISNATSRSVAGNGLRARTEPLADLTTQERNAWASLRASRAEFRTPFFSLEFAEAVERAREDVSVAIIENADAPVGFLPFHRIGNAAYPVGRFFNDAHNMIAAPETKIEWNWLLRELRIQRFEFHAMAGASPDDFPAHACHEEIRSFRSELGDDSEAFLGTLAQTHKTIRKQGQKTRKLAREVGPVSMEFDCRCPKVLQRMIEWKRRQYRRTYILDLFTPDWTRRLIEELFDRPKSAEVRGVLSVLRAGDEVVAAHFGMINHGLLHYWFPAYHPGFGLYSPGTALFCSVVEQATANGIDCIDMGYGEQPYKLKQTDTVSVVARGCMSRSRVYRHMRCIGSRIAAMTKWTPAKEPLKRIWRTLRPNAGIAKLT